MRFLLYHAIYSFYFYFRQRGKILIINYVCPRHLHSDPLLSYCNFQLGLLKTPIAGHDNISVAERSMAKIAKTLGPHQLSRLIADRLAFPCSPPRSPIDDIMSFTFVPRYRTSINLPHPPAHRRAQFGNTDQPDSLPAYSVIDPSRSRRIEATPPAPSSSLISCLKPLCGSDDTTVTRSETPSPYSPLSIVTSGGASPCSSPCLSIHSDSPASPQSPINAAERVAPRVKKALRSVDEYYDQKRPPTPPARNQSRVAEWRRGIDFSQPIYSTVRGGSPVTIAMMDQGSETGQQRHEVTRGPALRGIFSGNLNLNQQLILFPIFFLL